MTDNIPSTIDPAKAAHHLDKASEHLDSALAELGEAVNHYPVLLEFVRKADWNIAHEFYGRYGIDATRKILRSPALKNYDPKYIEAGLDCLGVWMSERD